MLRVPSMAKCAPNRQAMGMNTTQTAYELSKEQISFFRREGYLIVRGLFGADEVAALRGRFERLADDTEPAPKPQLWPVVRAATDPLQRYPRVMMPHHWDPLARQWLLDPLVGAILRTLLGDEPIAAQSMFYFKPPGARGQALHQDNFYLKVEPHTCIAAWMAIHLDAGEWRPESGAAHAGVRPGAPGWRIARKVFRRSRAGPPAGMDPVPATRRSGIRSSSTAT